MSEKKIIAVFGATGAQGGGLARAILTESTGQFGVRAVTRDRAGEKARALAALGAEVVAADADDMASLDSALAGTYGAFCVTNYWEHFSAEREGVQATNMARATRRAGVQHVIWSTLEDTRRWIPLDDPRLPTLNGKYKVPHFDSKGAVDGVFANEAAPTSYLLAAFYWENFIHFGMGPRATPDGTVLALPLGGAPLPGIAAADIGKCALGIFKRGRDAIGQRFGVSGENLSGDSMAAKMAAALGVPIRFVDVPFDTYRGLGFPGAEDLGNMFQFQAIRGDEFLKTRSPVLARELNADLLSFDAWLAQNKSRLSVA